jgi:hypothetical protein
MAEFTLEKAKVQNVYYLRRVGPDKIKYERQPFNLVTYDDGSGVYVEPISYNGLSPYTWSDVNTLANASEILILDTPVAFTGVTEIR